VWAVDELKEDRMKSRFSGMLAVGVVALLALPAAASAALRVTPRSPVVAGSSYLALGDSVTFGYMESNVVPAPNYHIAASFLGYPEQFGAQLRVNVANAACPGETSSSLINQNAISNGCENVLGKPGGYRTLYPLHVKYTGSQLAYAVSYLKSHPGVRLVSLMIGANDAFVCQETTKDGCLGPGELQAVFTKVAANVRVILSAIRNRARYRGQIAIQNYYSLNYTVPLETSVSTGLNNAMDGAAKPFSVEVTDSFGLMRLAANTGGAQGNTCKAGLLTQLSTGSCGVHPSYAGQAVLAQALIEGVRIG
jgi:lysophospholipase L1-like esterase